MYKVRYITFSFSSLDYLHELCFTLVRSELEYASAVWNSLTSTDANKLVSIQQKFASEYFYRFFSLVFLIVILLPYKNQVYIPYVNGDMTLTHFYFQDYLRLKSCTSLLENVSLRVPTRSVRDFLTFSVCPSNEHSFCSVRLSCQRGG
jgi:hypothetical protein